MQEDKGCNRVLVADDNNFVRFVIRQWIGTEAEIVEVEKGNDVLARYLEVRPDVLFLDIHLPGKNGKDILKDVLEADPSAFVVMLSADSKKDNVVFSIQEGAKAFMTKPFTRETLQRFYHLCPKIQTNEQVFIEPPAQSEAVPAPA